MSAPGVPKIPGRYGRRVIGDKAYEQAKQVEDVGALKFGPRILGQEKYDELVARQQGQQSENAESEKKGTDPVDVSLLEDLVEKYKDEDGYLSINNVKAILEEMPNAFDRVFGWEIARADGPRAGVLKHLRELEVERIGGPRDPVLQTIDQAEKQRKARKGD